MPALFHTVSRYGNEQSPTILAPAIVERIPVDVMQDGPWS